MIHNVLPCGHLQLQHQHFTCMTPRQLKGEDTLRTCTITAYLEESGRAALALLACKLSWQLRRHRPISHQLMRRIHCCICRRLHMQEGLVNCKVYLGSCW